MEVGFAGVVGGDNQKVVWERQAAPNLSDTEGPQRFIPFPALKVWIPCEESTDVNG